MTDQKIRVKSLEIVAQTLALLPLEDRAEYLSRNNDKAVQNIINASLIFEEYIKNATHKQQDTSAGL
jgi:hypothetical protein